MRGEVFAPGDMCGSYEIVRLVGVGGYAEVYAAISPYGDFRAVKVLRLTARASKDTSERFRREIQLLSCIDHAHIVRFFEAGVIEPEDRRDTILWVALEYLEGKTLREIIDKHPRGIPVDSLLRWGRQMAEGLAEAHRARATHRDLKPENVAIAPGDLAKVFDFGIAKFHAWGVKSTFEGKRLGTALYMAPEQVRDAKVDARTDVYALGLCLYEAACGRHPFGGPTADGNTPTLRDVCDRQESERPEPLAGLVPGFPPDLSAVVDRALEKDPRRRFQSMDELSSGLAEVMRHRRSRASSLDLGYSPVAPPVTTEPMTRPPPARLKQKTALLVVGVILGAAAGLAAYELRSRWSSAPPTSTDSETVSAGAPPRRLDR